MLNIQGVPRRRMNYGVLAAMFFSLVLTLVDLWFGEIADATLKHTNVHKLLGEQLKNTSHWRCSNPQNPPYSVLVKLNRLSTSSLYTAKTTDTAISNTAESNLDQILGTRTGTKPVFQLYCHVEVEVRSQSVTG